MYLVFGKVYLHEKSVLDVFESVLGICKSVLGVLESVFGICKSVFQIRQLSQCRSSSCWWRLVIASFANQRKRQNTMRIKNNENKIDKDIQQIQNKDNQQGPKR